MTADSERDAGSGGGREIPTLRIRAATPDDHQVIERIENAADRLLIERLQPDRWNPASAGAERDAAAGFLLVGETDVDSGPAVVGFAHVLEVDRFAHLEQLSVTPEHGRRGFGRRLVEAALHEARTRGYRRVSLRTYAEVPWNAPFYARLGFTEAAPNSAFHRQLADTERTLALERYGRRIQMEIDLYDPAR